MDCTTCRYVWPPSYSNMIAEKKFLNGLSIFTVCTRNHIRFDTRLIKRIKIYVNAHYVKEFFNTLLSLNRCTTPFLSIDPENPFWSKREEIPLIRNYGSTIYKQPKKHFRLRKMIITNIVPNVCVDVLYILKEHKTGTYFVIKMISVSLLLVSLDSMGILYLLKNEGRMIISLIFRIWENIACHTTACHVMDLPISIFV